VTDSATHDRSADSPYTGSFSARHDLLYRLDLAAIGAFRLGCICRGLAGRCVVAGAIIHVTARDAGDTEQDRSDAGDPHQQARRFIDLYIHIDHLFGHCCPK
jgi:hypothetical protein